MAGVNRTDTWQVSTAFRTSGLKESEQVEPSTENSPAGAAEAGPNTTPPMLKTCTVIEATLLSPAWTSPRSTDPFDRIGCQVRTKVSLVAPESPATRSAPVSAKLTFDPLASKETLLREPFWPAQFTAGAVGAQVAVAVTSAPLTRGSAGLAAARAASRSRSRTMSWDWLAAPSWPSCVFAADVVKATYRPSAEIALAPATGTGTPRLSRETSRLFVDAKERRSTKYTPFPGPGRGAAAFRAKPGLVSTPLSANETNCPASAALMEPKWMTCSDPASS